MSVGQYDPTHAEPLHDVDKPRRRKSWSADLEDEVSNLRRLLTRQPWLVAGRDDAEIAAVRRNHDQLRATFVRLGWQLVVDKDLVRLLKSPPPRPATWAIDGPNSQTCTWFFLLVAAAESLPPRVSLAQLVNAARAAAAEAEIPDNHDISDRRAIVAALKELDHRGVIENLEGDLEQYLTRDDAPVLLAIHHTRLLHVIANGGSAPADLDPDAWLAGVHRESDPARRMRRRLVDDALVHQADLDDHELDWLRRRLRGDDGGPLAEAFGLVIERRAEGAAFVVPDEAYRHPRELGPAPFPISGGTVPHAALLLCDHAIINGLRSHTPTDAGPGPGTHDGPDGSGAPVPQLGHAAGPGPGWVALTHTQVISHLRHLAGTVGSGRGGWAAELVEDPDLLSSRIRDLLVARDLLRPDPPLWWFSPATARWPTPPAAAARPRPAPDDTDGASPLDIVVLPAPEVPS